MYVVVLLIDSKGLYFFKYIVQPSQAYHGHGNPQIIINNTSILNTQKVYEYVTVFVFIPLKLNTVLKCN